MLENPTPAAAQPEPTNLVKRYAPPNQRNRPLNRRKSDRFDRSNSLYANDAEKNQQHAPSRIIPIVDHGDVGSRNLLGEHYRRGIIALGGCCHSEAAQLLNDRWALAIHKYNDTSIDLSDRPVMYSGSSASAWGHIRFPHQFMTPANSGKLSSGSQMDFLSELRRQMRSANANSDN